MEEEDVGRVGVKIVGMMSVWGERLDCCWGYKEFNGGLGGGG